MRVWPFATIENVTVVTHIAHAFEFLMKSLAKFDVAVAHSHTLVVKDHITVTRESMSKHPSFHSRTSFPDHVTTLRTGARRVRR
jgi:hypothetical protein